MKKISKANLTKLVKKDNLEITRKLPVRKPSPAKKKESIPVGQNIAVKSAQVVAEMAKSLSDTAVKMNESTQIMAQIAKTINKTEPKSVVKPVKKRKWKFTPTRGYDQLIEHITVEEL